MSLIQRKFGGKMKKQIWKTVVILLTAMLVFGLAGCPNGTEKKTTSSGDATLTGINVAGRDGTVGNAISAQQWDDTSFPLTTDGYTGTLFYATGMDSSPAILLTKQAKATVQYGSTYAATRPQAFTPNPPTRLANGNFLYIMIIAENGVVINYYRFEVKRNDSIEINQIRVGPASGNTSNASLRNNANPPAYFAFRGENALQEAIAATADNPNTVKLTITDARAKNAEIFLEFPTNMGPNPTVEYAVVMGNAAPSFSETKNGFDFLDGINTILNTIYLKATSEDGVNVAYYKVAVTVEFDAKLRTANPIVLRRTQPTPAVNYNVDDIGKPGNTWDTVEEEGAFAPGIKRLTAGFGQVTATPAATGATVTWAVTANGNTEPSFGTTAPVIFDYNGGYFWVKVVAVDSITTLIYKIKVDWMAEGTMYYGTPSLTDPTNPSNTTYIDPMWNTETWAFDVSRVNTNETYDAWFKQPYGRHTSGRAKALWDDDGIWVYAEVDFSNYKESSEGVTETRTISALSTTNAEHQEDSVEIFINERLAHMNLPTTTGNNWGNQYRVSGANILSGVAGQNDPSGAGAALTVFRNSGKTKAWARPNNEGYVVIAQVPWTFSPTGTATTAAKNQAAAIWNADGTIKEGIARIGFELQINACATNGHRDGILTWNGVLSQAYENARGYGEVVLEMGTGRTRPASAERPQITTQPLNLDFEMGSTDNVNALTVAVATPSSPTAALTYQWWSATTDTAAGAAISGETGTSYTPPTTLATGVNRAGTFYWVVVTNTDNSADAGYRIRTTTSVRAKVRVYRDETFKPKDYVVENEVEDTVLPIINETAWDSAYNSGYAIFLGEDFDVKEYDSFTVVFKGYNADENGNKSTEITEFGSSSLQMKYYSTEVNNANAAGETTEQYNVGQPGQLESGVVKTIPTAVVNAGLKTLTFQTGSNYDVPFFEVISIIFHMK
jgi:hypothetical protein